MLADAGHDRQRNYNEPEGPGDVFVLVKQWQADSCNLPRPVIAVACAKSQSLSGAIFANACIAARPLPAASTGTLLGHCLILQLRKKLAVMLDACRLSVSPGLLWPLAR